MVPNAAEKPENTIVGCVVSYMKGKWSKVPSTRCWSSNLHPNNFRDKKSTVSSFCLWIHCFVRKKNVFPKVFLPKEKIMPFSDSVIDSVGPSQHSRHCPQCNLFHSRINTASAFLDLKKVMFTASKGFSAFIACAVTSHSQKNKTHNVIICKFTSKPCAGWISQEWRRLQPKHEYKTLVIRNSILKSLKRLFWEWSSLCWSWMGIPWGQKGRNFF